MSAYDLYVRLSTHPVAEGAAALVALVGALAAPIVGGYALTVAVDPAPVGAYGLGGIAALTGVWAFNRVLYRTRVYDWVARLFVWTGVRGITNEGETL